MAAVAATKPLHSKADKCICACDFLSGTSFMHRNNISTATLKHLITPGISVAGCPVNNASPPQHFPLSVTNAIHFSSIIFYCYYHSV